MNDYCEIPLTRGKVALVDKQDYEWLMQWKWHAAKAGYAVRTVNGGSKIFMHREIMKAVSGEEVDHIDGDGFNNRRVNLRVCTHSDNLKNSAGRSDNKSGFKGVSWDNRKQRWRATIQVNGKYVSCGTYSTPEAAAYAYNQKAIELHKEFAKLNNLDPNYKPNRELRRNNTSGIPGCYWHKAKRKWQAKVSINGEDVHLGYFIDINEAESAIREAEQFHLDNPGVEYVPPHKQKLPSRNTTGYRGVSFHKQRKKFYAQKKVDGKVKFLGFFETAEEASKAYEDFNPNTPGST